MSVTASANALATLADVKYEAGIKQDDTTRDDRIQTLINKISGRIEDWCGRAFKKATYEEEAYDGDGECELLLKQFPIDVTALSIDGVEVDLEDSLAVKVYEKEGYIWYGPGFSKGRQNVLVSYSGGYETIPEGLQQACIEWVIILLEGRMKDAKVKGEDTKTIMPDQILSGVLPYRRMDG